MKWLRFICVATVIGLASCSSPSAPKYPDPDEETDPNKNEPGPKNGLLITPSGEVTFWV